MANTKIPVELSSTPGIVDNSDATAITIDSSENVGIGTTSPDGKLDVRGTIFVNGDGTGGRIFASSGNLSLSDGNGRQILRIDDPGSGNSHSHIFDSNGRLGVGTTSPDAILETSASATGNTVGALITNTNQSGTADSVSLNFGLGRTADSYIRSVEAIKVLKEQQWTSTASTVDCALVFSTTSNETTAERMRISSTGDVSIGTTSNTNDLADASSGNGFAYSAEASRDFLAVTRDSGVTAYFNRIGNGDVIAIRKNGATKGTISVNDATVSYNPFMGSHYSETSDSEILLGTVMEYTGELVENYNIEEKRLSKVKISDTSESTKVYGIYFANGDEIGDLIAGLGASWCRINKDVTVQLGDLLVSNGDGTAKVQSDDIIRSKTIGKVTSTTVKETYSDGSYVVPVVLYCG